MKKTAIVILTVLLLLFFAACACASDDAVNLYNKTAREGWDVYASLECFVKTEYNKEGNPVLRSLYSVSTWEKELVIRYRYDKDGSLAELLMDGKDSQNAFFKNLRFALSFNEDALTQTARPLHGSDVFKKISFTWDENRKLVSEYVKATNISDFTYDETGGIANEHFSEAEKDLTHRYGEDGSILITEADSLNEVMSVTLGENGMPSRLVSADYTSEYTYNEKNLCTKIEIEVLGKTVSEVEIAYDEAGNPTRRELKTHEGGKTVVAALYEYAYDEKGNLTKETLSQADKSLALEVVWESEYSYNNQGEVSEKTHFTYPSPAKRHTVYEYDDVGNRIGSSTVVTNLAGTIIRDKGSERYYTSGKLLSRTTYSFHNNHTLEETVKSEYSEEGDVLKKTISSYRQGKKVDGVLEDGILRSIRIKEYAEGEVLAQILYKEYTQKGLLSSKETTTYLNGNAKSYVSMKYNSDGSSVREKTTREYYDNSVVLKFDETVSYDKNGVVSDRMSTEKDEKGNTLKWTHLQMGGTEKEYDQVWEYTYHDNGKVKTLRQTHLFCGVVNLVLENEFYTSDDGLRETRFEYQNGKIHQKEECFYENGQLQKKTVCQYDENGNEISREETVNG